MSRSFLLFSKKVSIIQSKKCTLVFWFLNPHKFSDANAFSLFLFYLPSSFSFPFSILSFIIIASLFLSTYFFELALISSFHPSLPLFLIRYSPVIINNNSSDNGKKWTDSLVVETRKKRQTDFRWIKKVRKRKIDWEGEEVEGNKMAMSTHLPNDCNYS